MATETPNGIRCTHMVNGKPCGACLAEQSARDFGYFVGNAVPERAPMTREEATRLVTAYGDALEAALACSCMLDGVAVPCAHNRIATTAERALIDALSLPPSGGTTA